VREHPHNSKPHNSKIVKSQAKNTVKSLKAWLAMAALIAVFPASAMAVDADLGSDRDAYQDHVELPVSPFWFIEKQFGQRWASADLSAFGQIGRSLLDLLDYLRESIDRSEHSLAQSVDRYNRLKHFGGWIRPDQSDCRNTRAVVMVRDADRRTAIEYRNGRECVVNKGKWNDPFTGSSFRLASALDIDHIVPLKQAYVSGAHAWDPPKRCHYANYLEADYHLMTVSGSENKRKSDRSPEQYMPPNERFHCRYLSIWVRIKAIWELSASPEEHQTIESIIREKNCKLSEFKMPAAELRRLRVSANRPMAACESFGRRSIGQGELSPDGE
jgi:hypothetical protein